MDIKAIFKMKEGHVGHCCIDSENNLTGTFISGVLKPEELLDLT